MTDFRGIFPRKDPADRGLLMIIDQATAIFCTDASDFTSNVDFTNMLLSNVTVNVSEISNSDTRYGNIKSQKTKHVDSETLANHWKIDLGKSNNTMTQLTQRGVRSFFHPTLGRQYPTND